MLDFGEIIGLGAFAILVIMCATLVLGATAEKVHKQMLEEEEEKRRKQEEKV